MNAESIRGLIPLPSRFLVKQVDARENESGGTIDD